LSTYLISCGILISKADNSLFCKFDSHTITIILVYVDDIIVIGNNLEEIKNVKRKLNERFDIKDLEILKYFIGFEFAYYTRGIFTSQRKYILDLLKEIDKLGCKPASTPIDSKCKLNTEDGEPLEDINLFQQLVRKLIYLTVTRPNISYSISQISKFMHTRRTPHLEAINRISRYLKNTLGNGI
jgi:Reverse transcriptase (RNA-dependent DNA polymerase)